jgi:hypothetical protein
MNTIILAWVLVVGAHGDNTPPIISPLVADLASCERMQQAVRIGRDRSSQCVEIKVLK